ncbi:MAG: imidazole glycerol phosphate synthase subunit HisH [Candidatus Marinimicrobia bacterium]|nr:imidazole glycerol phosphate synthase subunit HisH [Candidatus Neomarinimicrobiota bacterium]|tara:strand:+ start:258 stop:869 length:612 start_codon:yes stop_codon:yes gene_type:complete
MITVINYGLGNINAIKRVYNNLNVPVKIATNVNDLENSQKYILPGVGAFDYAMQKLEESGLKDILNHKIINEKKYILGICVGMQIMAKSSDEGKLSGLGWLEADVKKLDDINDGGLSIPHMGWNNIIPNKRSPILNGLNSKSRFYFLHSYYLETHFSDIIIAKANYGNDFICAINQNNIYGVQFHPEKSHNQGIELLKNFAEL